MERVAFLDDATGQRISNCLLNPESLVLRRQAGVRSHRAAGGLATGHALGDDPVFFTGGGITELELDLLFDVALEPQPGPVSDVRELTGPLWDLSENDRRHGAYGRLPVVRFFWGKWHMPGIVVAVAERLEQFDSHGIPGRSWLRMRLRRVDAADSAEPDIALDDPAGLARGTLPGLTDGPVVTPEVYEISGAGPAPEGADGAATETNGTWSGTTERLDQIAYRFYGNPLLAIPLAAFNRIVDPLRLRAGQLIELPPLADLRADLLADLEDNR
jgi:hypothetical protein